MQGRTFVGGEGKKGITATQEWSMLSQPLQDVEIPVGAQDPIPP